MTHHILIGQLADTDALDIFEHAHRLLETAQLIGGQVDLRRVAGDDHFRAEAHAGKEHFHLLAGGVLRLVENDKAVVERAAAHIGERRDLDVAALEILLIGLRAEHVKERVVERAEVGINLALQVAGQKAEPLARLDRGARENDAVDLPLAERRDRGGDGEIGLARASGTDADGDGILRNGVHILLLPDGLGLDGAALGADADDVLRQLADLLLLSRAGQSDDIADVLLVDGLAAVGERQKCGEGLAGEHGVLRLAVDAQLALAVGDGDVEFRLDEADILVKRAEEVDRLLQTFNADALFHRKACPFISSCGSAAGKCVQSVKMGTVSPICSRHSAESVTSSQSPCTAEATRVAVTAPSILVRRYAESVRAPSSSASVRVLVTVRVS